MRKTTSERFDEHVTKGASCWIWTGGTNGVYGKIFENGRYVGAHRWSYKKNKGLIPAGCDVRPRCRQPLCVNPDHLEAVRRRVTLLAGLTITARNAHVTKCPAGHPYDQANTYLYRGLRYCNACRAARNKRS